MVEKVEVEYDGKKYVFTLRDITYGERKRILKRVMRSDTVDYSEAEHLVLAYSIENVEPNDVLDVSLKTKDFNKFLKAIEDLPDRLIVPVAMKAVVMNPLMG